MSISYMSFFGQEDWVVRSLTIIAYMEEFALVLRAFAVVAKWEAH